MARSEHGDDSESAIPDWVRDLTSVILSAAPDGLPEGMGIESLLAEAIEMGSAASYNTLIAMAPRYVIGQRLQRSGFERRLRARWYRSFFLFDLFILTAWKYGSDFNERHRPEAVAENDLVFESLTRIHGRACLVAHEIRALMAAGFASGALARWRTLHELSAVAYFISSHGQDMAERYLLHEVVVTAKELETYLMLWERLGFSPLETEEVEIARSSRVELVKRFGKNFGDDWGWAAGDPKVRVTFERIEKEAGLDHLRPIYRLASNSIHAGFKGSTFDIGLLGRASPKNLIHSGPTNAGLASPGQYTVYSLLQCTTALLNLNPAPDTFSGLMMLAQLSEEVGRVFTVAHRKLVKDEAQYS